MVQETLQLSELHTRTSSRLFYKLNLARKFDRSHPVLLYQYNCILVYKHSNFYHKMTIISFFQFSDDNCHFMIKIVVSID
jgi:hypothetical protein